MALRKNQHNLIAWEKTAFYEAVLALKAEQKPGNTNTYDQYVQLHYDNVLAGHFGPAFFAWHREFLRRFEGELQRITGDKSFGLPYWDWSVDNSKTSSIWGPDFMGGNGNAGLEWQVQDGPFAYSARNQGDPRKWSLNVRTSSEPFPYLRRQLETYIPTLPTPADVQAALQTTPYDVAPWDDTSLSGFRNTAEGYIPDPPGMHARVHVWVGGSMTTMTSPNDPIFWLHHCYVDKLWADWQAMHPDQQRYLPTSGDPRKGQNLNDPMPPWNEKRPADVLNTADLGYHYDTDDYLMANDVLYPGQTIYSAGRRYYLYYNPNDNNVRLGSPSWQEYWASTDRPQSYGRCIMQDDGNLVISDRYNKVMFASNTYGNPGAYLWVSGDAPQVGIYRSDNSPTNFLRPPPKTG